MAKTRWPSSSVRGTIILAVSLIIWLLATVPNGDINTSVLAHIGKFFEPLGKTDGLQLAGDGRAFLQLYCQGKHNCTLGTLLGGTGAGLNAQLKTLLTPAAAVAFLVVQVLFIPCVATVAAIRQETKTWKWPLFTDRISTGIIVFAGNNCLPVARLL